MTLETCDLLIEQLESEIKQLDKKLDLFGAGKGYESQIEEKTNQLKLLEEIAKVKNIKSCCQQYESILIKEFETEAGHTPITTETIRGLSNATNKKEIKEVWKKAELLGKIDKSIARSLPIEIKSIARSLLPVKKLEL